MDQNVPKNGPIPAQAKIPNLWPILLCNTAIMGFFGVEMPIMTFLMRFRQVCIRIRAKNDSILAQFPISN